MAIEVYGGKKVSGEIRIQGSKNAVLPLMAASLLCEGQTVIHHCPQIRDVQVMQEVMQELGSRITFCDHSLCMEHSCFGKCCICQDKVKELRASILLMGSCLARFGEVTIAYPGGCSIGKRPIDFHIQAFRRMGVTIVEEEDKLCCHCKNKIHGAHIVLPFPSVGATENIILAAVLAEGETEIQNAAREPEIVELCRFLRQAGAIIKGEGTSIIRIEGKRMLQGGSWILCGDRIVFLTFAMLVAGCGGELVLYSEDLFGERERTVWHSLGGREEVGEHMLLLRKHGVTRPIPYLNTGPYPEFPTDGQSLLLPVLTKANGISTIEERVFERRFQMIGQLQKMGANIDSVSNRARITGVTKLHGADVAAQDLRSGAGLLIAAAMAEGTSRIRNEEYIQRGYENIVENMNALGFEARYCQEERND